MPKQLVGYNTRTYVINTDLTFCSKPNMSESHNSMIVFQSYGDKAFELFQCTGDYEIYGNQQQSSDESDSTPAKPKGALYELLRYLTQYTGTSRQICS